MDSDAIAKTLVATPERMTALRTFIDSKLAKTRIFDKYGLTLTDSDEIIVTSLMGELRNMVLAFFKGGDLFHLKRCDSCKSTTASQYDRAHDRSLSRESVALNALKRIRPTGTGTVAQKDFLRAFIEEHKNHPLWYLCRSCHHIYDKV
jgi:hypothetical protein